ncbi:MAG: TonB-dependent receptor domain-containing protein, partial [Syntrophothermus sp.]
VGVRYEVYRPNGFDLKGLWGKGDLIKSYNGSFLNPRINFSYNLAEETQLRLSYGVTSKAPPLGMIAAQKKYFDIVDTVSVRNPSVPESNFSIISTNIRNIANENIKGYKQNKYEISLDQQIGSVGFTVTGYHNNSDYIFDEMNTPTVFYKYSYPTWPDVSSRFVKDSLLDSYKIYGNNKWQKVSGIEITFRTRKIPVINTIFTFDAAYTHQETGLKNNIEYGLQRYSSLLGIKLIPVYKSNVDITKDFLLNYRFEIQSKTLGMWITLHIQQKLIEFNRKTGFGDSLAIGYFTQKGEFITIPENEKASSKYSQLSKNVEYYMLLDEDPPNKFLFNIKVSKSLWSGASVSFYVNNFLNSKPVYRVSRSNPLNPKYETRNPDIFYGIELSTALGGFNE